MSVDFVRVTCYGRRSKKFYTRYFRVDKIHNVHEYCGSEYLGVNGVIVYYGYDTEFYTVETADEIMHSDRISL